jgi:hypothetical protein
MISKQLNEYDAEFCYIRIMVLYLDKAGFVFETRLANGSTNLR